MSHQISRSISLANIPERKILEWLEETIKTCTTCASKANVKLDHSLCKVCRLNNKRIQRYAEANIPVMYWKLEMDEKFVGDPILKEKYLEITQDLAQAYQQGFALCFGGKYGTGKTLACCNVLKRAVEKNYSGLYVNLSDVVAVMLNGKDSEDRAIARKELLLVDFLVIDEFDPRYMSSDKSADLFGKILEEIFRSRHQNKLPTLMCTNSPDLVKRDLSKIFSGPLRESIQSLLSQVEMIPVLGPDQRLLSLNKKV